MHGGAVIAFAALAVVCATFGSDLKRRGYFSAVLSLASSRAPAVHCVDLLGDNPITIRPTPVHVESELTRDDLRRYSALIATNNATDPEAEVRSRAVHVCRLWQFAPALPRWLTRDGRGVIDRVKIATPAFSPSWRGLDMAERPDHRRSEHRDQMLSTLAELGVPLSASIGKAESGHTVRDLLRTSMNEFHLKQREIAWTAVAYARYLPPQSRWENRLGEEYSFDQLVAELMRRPLNGGSCRGIHLLTALTTVLLCHRETSVLSSSAREKALAHLKRYVEAAVESQRPDGSWPLRWSALGYFDEAGDFTPKASLEGNVVVRGHLLEWFHWLPAELKPPEATMRAGLTALSQQLKASSRELIIQEFCPYTHALTALFLASSI